MNNPFIQLINCRGVTMSINITKIVSISKMQYENSENFFTFIVLDGGGGAYVATHNIKKQYEELIEIINDYFINGRL